jgi:Domain of unknown function (DUF4277)
MSANGPFELHSQALGALPIVHRFLERMRVGVLLERHLPPADARVALDPARAIGLLVGNLCVSHEPLYRLGEWAAPFDPALLGLSAEEVAQLGDDQLGRALDRLFCADRASLLTELVLGVIAEFGVDCSQLHNDSTSITLHGAYEHADGHERAGKPTPAVCAGHNKDHRPDLKQLLWILTVSADGALPLAYRLTDPNTTDDQTHIETWETLRALTGGAGFLYVADCKLCTRQQMEHIDRRGGRFVTVLPRSRKEDGFLRDWVQSNAPQWSEAQRKQGKRTDDPAQVWWTAPAPIPSAEGYRIIWVRSSAKIGRDAQAAPAARRARPEGARRAEHAPSGPQEPPAHPRGCRAGRRCRARPSGRRALDHPHRLRDRRGDLPSGEARPAGAEHPLPPAHHHPLCASVRRQRRDGRLRRGHRRLLPTDLKRP